MSPSLLVHIQAHLDEDCLAVLSDSQKGWAWRFRSLLSFRVMLDIMVRAKEPLSVEVGEWRNNAASATERN